MLILPACSQPLRALVIALILMLGLSFRVGASPSSDASVSLNAGWQLQDAAKVAPDGKIVSTSLFRPGGWYKATVPGTVLTSLVNDGIYPEPLYGENNRPDKIPDSLCRASYWYRKTFTVPAAYAGKHVWLNFDGINYEAEVWVNGHDLGPIKGAFARGLFDITPDALPGKPSVLAVEIFPEPHPGIPLEQTIANGVGHNGGETARDGPTFLCSIGWDWIPGIRDRNMGLWQGVSLSATGPVTLKDTYVTSDLPLPRTDSADLTVQTTLRNVGGKPQAGLLIGTFGQTTFRSPVTLGAGETRTVTLTPADIPALHVVRPRLWWPNGYGPQNLYILHLRFVQNKLLSDTTDTTFGIRKITYSVPGSDNLTISVNGVPILCKGGDWGMDEAMKRIPAARIDAEVRMHKQAHYTMIRNWVGQSTSEALYDACDKYGLLLWDEFFQPNPGDGPNPDDTTLYLANVREKILRFRSHPSIAVWCARNEGLPPPVIDAGIQKLMAELERGRLYQPSSASGRGVNSHGPYYWRTPREYYEFGEAFKTEIGSVSIPTLEAIEAMMPVKDWNTINDDWAEHDLAGGAQRGDTYPHVLADRYGPIRSLADFARKGQMANYESFRAMYEGRNAKLFHPVTGVLTWMSNPAQPSFVWQLYSWDLEPNSALFAAREACEPVHIQMNQTNWHVMVINNTPQALSGITAKTSVYNLDGSLQYTHTDTAAAAPSAATDLGLIAFPEGLSAVHFVKLELRDAQNQLLSDNFYWRETQQDNFQALNTLPQVTLTASVARHDRLGKCLLTVLLHNPAKAVALMTHLQLRDARTHARILPVFYSDNYVSLLPGERKTVTIEASAASLNGDAPQVLVDGWNVSVTPSPGIAPNTGALHLGPAVSAASHAPGSPIQIQINSLQINCGGAAASLFFKFGAVPASGFEADADFSGGKATIVSDAIDTNDMSVAHAPVSVYQSERWGACAYTLPAAAGKTYRVRLHFAETTFDAAGQRKFNVDINGRRVLTDFDVYADAGGKDKAVVKDFPGIVPDASGHIVIAFTNGSADQPKICGIELIALPIR
jgi:hypothetical protein